MKRFIQTVGLVFAVLWLWHGGMSVAASPRIALVIGNSAYKIAPSLPNPANDARLMAETLRGLGFEVIERIDADRDNILLAIFELQDRLIAAGKDTVGLFFYAGHGVQVSGENYFIPLRTEINQEREISVKAVSASFVLQQMEFAQNRMNFIILDACRNNPFPASTRATTRGLARMNAPSGSLVAYSTGPGEVAADGSGANSPYVLALTEAMRTPGLPAELMFKRVRETVLEATNDTQTPWEESSLKGGDFYFSGGALVAVETPTAAPVTPSAVAIGSQADSAATERLFWLSIKDTTDPEMFEAYLMQYPRGTFMLLARIRLKALKQAQTAMLAPPPEPASITPSVEIKLQPVERELNEENIKNSIFEFYNNNRIIKEARPEIESPNYWVTTMISISSITLTRVSDTLVTADLNYRWELADATYYQRIGSAIATIEIVAEGYKVIKFETDGYTYLPKD